MQASQTPTHVNTLARPASAWLLRLMRLQQRFVKAVRQWRRERKAYRELQLLDDGALRDLGMHRSEYLSYLTEAVGAADQTRRRVSGCAD